MSLSGTHAARILFPAAALVLGFGVPAAVAEAAAPEARLLSELSGDAGRFGLRGSEARAFEQMSAPSPTNPGSGFSPFVAGMMSAVVPGSGQLVQGQSRGWLYLGIEAAAWFSFFAIRSAGNQAEEDYREYADLHWDLQTYQEITECEGGGPMDFDQELEEILDFLENSREDYYESIGRRDVYACGWDDPASRGSYLSMRTDANNLFRSSRIAGSIAFLNHVVSAVDAAKSAARARKNRSLQSLEWGVSPNPNGPLAFHLALRREF